MPRLRWIALVFSLVSLAALFSLWSNKRPHPEQGIAAVKSDNTQEHRPQMNLTARLRAPRQNGTQAWQNQTAVAERLAPPPDLSEGCQNFLRGFASIDLQAYLDGNMGQDLELPDDKRCSDLPKEYLGARNIYLASCAREQPRPACYRGLLIMRSTIADAETSGLTAAEISDPVLLAQKLIAKLYASPEAAVDFASRLVELDPDFYPAVKINALLQFARMSSSLDMAQQPKLNEIFERAASLNPNDKALYEEMQVALKLITAKTVEEKKAIAAEAIASKPGEAMSVYLESWRAYQDGHVDDAMAKLMQAQKLAPDDQRIASTLTALKEQTNADQATALDKKIYSFTYDFDPAGLIP